MDNRSNTPQWQRPPTRTGPIADDHPAWVELLDCNAGAIALGIAAVVLGLAAYVWGVDWLCGHL
jgi:hypothetical protein